MSEKTKLLYIGDGVTPTGFSRVSHGILSNLPKDAYDIHHLAINYSGDPHPFDYKIYPAVLSTMRNADVLGLSRLPYMVNTIEPDVIFILQDVWNIALYLDRLKKIYEVIKKKLPKIVVYFPVDGQELNPHWFKDFDVVTKTVAYTKFGKSEILKAAPDIFVDIIPHGVDTKTFYRMSGDKVAVRKAFFKSVNSKIDPNAFIVLNANRNQPRKNLDLSLGGFALFAKEHKDAYYYHHAGLKDSGWDILSLIDSLSKEHGFDLGARIILSNKEIQIQQVPDSVLNVYYNIASVGLNTSSGEGWGLTNVENAVVGVPQVVPNHSVSQEVLGESALYVDTVLQRRDLTTLLTREYVSQAGIAEALNILYNNQDIYDKMSRAGIQRFTSDMYQWSVIGLQWHLLIQEALSL